MTAREAYDLLQQYENACLAYDDARDNTRTYPSAAEVDELGAEKNLLLDRIISEITGSSAINQKFIDLLDQTLREVAKIGHDNAVALRTFVKTYEAAPRDPNAWPDLHLAYLDACNTLGEPRK